jgi:hypothetical protein
MTWDEGKAEHVLWVGDVLPVAYAHANWLRIRGYYRQLSDIARFSRTWIPTELREALADALLGISARYAGHEDLMCEHALAVFADVDGRESVDLVQWRDYYENDRLILARPTGPATRRLPNLMESVIETCRRRRDARRLREAFGDTPTSATVIGSTVYGPFYNVRGNRRESDASDLDCILVVEDIDGLEGIAERLAALRCASEVDVARFVRRARIFASDRYRQRLYGQITCSACTS